MAVTYPSLKLGKGPMDGEIVSLKTISYDRGKFKKYHKEVPKFKISLSGDLFHIKRELL
jgi:hypothetical protein